LSFSTVYDADIQQQPSALFPLPFAIIARDR
jgi:hypothetical protein